MNAPLTILILLATCYVSYRVMHSPSEKNKLLFIPYYVNQRREFYRFLSSGFIHQDWLHLGVNMFVLYLFGQQVEYIYKTLFGIWGALLFLALYLGGILASHIPSYIRHKTNPGYGSLGASGAVSGVLFASILFDPWQGIGLLFLPGLWIPGFVFGLLYMVYSSYMDKKGIDNIGHSAHLSGAVYGFLFTIAIHPKLLPHFIHCLTSRSDNCVMEFLLMQQGM